MRMQRLMIAVAAGVGVFSGCATAPMMVHNPTLPAAAGVAEFGGLINTAESVTDDVESTGARDLESKSDRSGYFGMAQYNSLYVKFDSAPTPGMWFGWGMRNTGSRIGWYPAIEITGSQGDSEESTKDGYITDSDGNRYLYEVTESSGGFGLASPQLIEFYPMPGRVAVYFAAIPALISRYETVTAEIVYEDDERFVRADPDLDAEWEELQDDIEKDESVTRWLMPLVIGVRAKHGPFHFRAFYADRTLDSIKDYSSTFKQLFAVSAGYQWGG